MPTLLDHRTGLLAGLDWPVREPQDLRQGPDLVKRIEVIIAEWT
jgi:hypothetical protein